MRNKDTGTNYVTVLPNPASDGYKTNT